MYIHNFKCKPEYTVLDILVKMFTFVVLKASEIIWTWKVMVVDKVIFSDTGDSKNQFLVIKMHISYVIK